VLTGCCTVQVVQRLVMYRLVVLVENTVFTNEVAGSLVSRDGGERLGVVQTELILVIIGKVDRSDCLARMKKNRSSFSSFRFLCY
jgi:hypothetical protein